jgi:hypothetical protein
MSKKPLKSKLSFNKETLRAINAASMAKVMGGVLHDMQPEDKTCENACGATTANVELCGTVCGPCSHC